MTFPMSSNADFPCCEAGEHNKYPEEVCRLDALLSLMAELDDTCVLYRGGVRGSERCQIGCAGRTGRGRIQQCKRPAADA